MLMKTKTKWLSQRNADTITVAFVNTKLNVGTHTQNTFA